MKACPELARLPKAKVLKSLHFKRITPGSITGALYPPFPSNNSIVDHTHPSAQIPTHLRRTRFPSFFSEAFELRVLPNALLIKPSIIWPDPPFHWDSDRKQAGRLNMSICMQQSTSVHSSSFLRGKMSTKIKTAVSLVVARGANVVTIEDRASIVFDESDAGEKWLLHGWTYLIRPTLSLHLMPYTHLIPLMRVALNGVKNTGDAMDKAWARGQLYPTGTRTTTARNINNRMRGEHPQPLSAPLAPH